MQTRFTNTDMYKPVRNYKPLLALLHNDPKKAYATYDQFRIAPISFEDSVAALIALVVLEPVMGPENKMDTGVAQELQWRSRESRIRELELLLARHQRGNDSTESIPLPASYRLREPYPNPFNSIVTFRFALPKAGATEFVVYDRLGRRVYQQSLGEIQAGSYLTHWNGINSSGMLVSSGVYFLRFRSGDFQTIKKIVLVK